MLKMKDILDEKDKRLRLVSKDVTFPLSKEDKRMINEMVEYLTNSQIERLAEKYDLRPGMGMAAIQLGVPKRFLTIVHEIDEEEFDTYIICNPKIISNSLEKIYVEMGGHLVNPQIELYVDGELSQAVKITVEIAEYEKLIYDTRENQFYIGKQNTDGTLTSLFSLDYIDFENDNVIRLPKGKSCEIKLTADNEVLNAQLTIYPRYKAV